uniref:Small ribosomal subunit protein mS39 n=1 Tax=Crocodylus porosus TaxID=8502 RepID=A0A7M4DWL3_CROPO
MHHFTKAVNLLHYITCFLQDPTAVRYTFHDDTYLIPRTPSELRLFAFSKESGKNAAKYIINEFPRYFERDIAEPHIPCLMPENLKPQIEGVSEAALKEHIQLRKVRASVDIYDQLLQAGNPVSLKTTNSLLDLLCFYGDQEPVRDYLPEKEMSEESESRENNNAERIFNLMPERNAHSYCTMIRGMVKHGAYQKAFVMYTDLLNERHRADVDTFNALILAVARIRETFFDKWEVIKDLLNCMARQNVQPSVLTFNNILKSLKYCGGLGRSVSSKVLNEMKAINIGKRIPNLLLISNVTSKIATSKDVIAVLFQGCFSPPTLQCVNLKDLKLAYRVHRVLEMGGSWKFLPVDQQYVYW